MLEFDDWLTPRQVNFKTTHEYLDQIDSIMKSIEILATHFNNFDSLDNWTIDALMGALESESLSAVDPENFLHSLDQIDKLHYDFFNLLFLATAKADNNLKAQYFSHLRANRAPIDFPFIRFNAGKSPKFTITFKPRPQTNPVKKLSKELANCVTVFSEKFERHVEGEVAHALYRSFLREYLLLILEEEEDLLQLWAICRAYQFMKDGTDRETLNGENPGRLLIAPSVLYKIRGSVTAKGGHLNEEVMRERLSELGLQRGSDFNVVDVIVRDDALKETENSKEKTRAFDFVIPFQTPGRSHGNSLFIQAQFYAGDSGSVSHKVVDQTSTSRLHTKNVVDSPRFVEFVDGAGYSGPLRGDLELILRFEDTSSFAQIKSILIRIRRELQAIDFITPVEIAHAIFLTEEPTRTEIHKHLSGDGYSDGEIERALNRALELNQVVLNGIYLTIEDSLIPISRRMLALDLIALNGSKLNLEIEDQIDYLLVPGYGPSFGLGKNVLVEKIKDIRGDFLDHLDADLDWLVDVGVVQRIG